ncbi:hypothetical protein FG386_000499 [Cryptosporidium ryanae]|uniref:uncharacterized protein n=1 Tax=Cryptosporidium ryanae TaxID=515981 RepID=UPI00351A1890|nr:hypothetical protein FG386_000499 [Cryptosporidium ryanae]
MSISSFKIKRRKKVHELENEEKNTFISESILEEVSPIQKYKNKPAIGVTTFSRQMWCEQSLEICLEKNIKVTSKAIEEGLRHHEELELEDHDVMDVLVENEYERIAVDMLSTVNLLNAVLERGYVRELPITGFFSGIMLRGIIDSIKLKPKVDDNLVEYSIDDISKYKILITDTKTRRNNTLPSNLQQKTTVIQLGLYKKILGEMINFGKDWAENHSDIAKNNLIIHKGSLYSKDTHDLESCCLGCNYLYKIFSIYDIDPYIKFKEYRESSGKNLELEVNCEKEIETDSIYNDEKDKADETEVGIDSLDALGSYENALQVGFHMLHNLSKLPEIQTEIKVEYDCQGKTFATKWYRSPDETIDTELEYLLSWWLGQRNTETIRVSESWKCKFCNVIEYCNTCPLSKDEKDKYIQQNRQNELDLILIKDLEAEK